MVALVLAVVAVAALLVAILPTAKSRRSQQQLAAAAQGPHRQQRSHGGHADRSALAPLRITPAHPGIAHVVFHGSPQREVALTIDDGFCATCVARIIHTLARTGMPATIFPNGTYGASWDPVAPTIRRLLAAGQLTIGNHTFLHHDPVAEAPDAFAADLSNNERWIEHTFGVSARPFFRPPYGAYNSSTVAIAGQQGYTKVILWSGTVADSTPHTIPYILQAIKYWAHPGSIILMHGNYPATSIALPQIYSILRQRGLRPVTMATLLR